MKNTLKVTLQGDREVVLTRAFNAPRAFVYDALTKPDLIKRWFGPHGWEMTLCEVDLKVGGKWRYEMHGPDNGSLTMFGDYRELDPPNGLVHSENFVGYPGEGIVTTRLTEVDGVTTLTATVLSESRQTRDAIIASGMERGASQTYDRLESLLQTLN